MLHFFLTLINWYYKILWLKSTSISKEQTRIPLKLNIEKIWCRQKRITIEHFLQISLHTDMRSTKEAIFQQTPPPHQINPFVVKSFLETNCKHYRKSAIRENFNLKPETQLKKTHSNNGGNYTHQYNEVKEKL